ncbi:MAG: ABC transporter substrate-binding protein [archaeon]
MERRKIKIIGIIVIMVIIALTIFEISITQFAIKDNKDTIKIGFIGPLTGEGAVVGTENLNGIKLAIDEINQDNKIKLFVQDDQYDARQAIDAYNNFVYVQGVKIIFINTYDGFLALTDKAEKDNVLLINSLDSSEEFSNLNDNTFSIGIYDESIGYAIADYLNNNNAESAGLITNLDDAFSTLTKNSFKQRFKGQVIEEDYSFSTTDFRSILTKVNTQDNIVMIGWEETGRIVKQAKELNINSEIIGIDTFVSEDFKKNAGNKENINGLIFTFWQGSENNPKFLNLIDSYKQEHNKDPDNVLFMTAGYDSASVLLNAMNQCNYQEDIKCIKTNLENTKDFQGAAGLITIDDDHVARSIKESMFIYEDGEVVEIN